MAKFTKGDKVVRTGCAHHRLELGREYTVANGAVSSAGDGEWITLEGVMGGSQPWEFLSEEFSLVQGPRWSDVEVGDKVRVRHERFGTEVDTEAYQSPNEHEGIKVLGWSVEALARGGVFAPGPGVTLLSIERPKRLPTTDGSIVIRNVGYLKPEFHLIGGEWRGAKSGNVGDPNTWAGGWTLVRDAGADS